jgi:hypothetical protein
MSSTDVSSCRQLHWLAVPSCHPATKTIPHIDNKRYQRQSDCKKPEQMFPGRECRYPVYRRQQLVPTGITATITMKFFATFFLLLLPITVGIQAVAAAEQVVLPNAPMDSNRPLSNARPTLFDLLTIQSSTSIFFSYARELQLSRMFVNVDSNLTLLVPTNKAVMALAKKP